MRDPPTGSQRGVGAPAASRPAFKDWAPRPNDVRDSRTTLRSPLNSAPDISALNRPAEGALGPYLRAIRAHRLLVIVVMLAAVGASHRVDRPASAELPGHREHPRSRPLAQEDTQFQGLNAVREAGDPTRTAQTAATLIKSTAAPRTHGARAGRRLDRREGARRDQRHAGGREQHPRGHRQGGRRRPRPQQLANTFARESLAARRDIIAKQATAEVERLKASQGDLGEGTEAAGDRDRADQRAREGARRRRSHPARSRRRPRSPSRRADPRWR